MVDTLCLVILGKNNLFGCYFHCFCIRFALFAFPNALFKEFQAVSHDQCVISFCAYKTKCILYSSVIVFMIHVFYHSLILSFQFSVSELRESRLQSGFRMQYRSRLFLLLFLHQSMYHGEQGQVHFLQVPSLS